jgi:hypothetical protein
LAETWTRRYSKTPEDKQNGDDKGESQEGEDEDSESYEYEESDEDLSYPEYESEGRLSYEFIFLEHAVLKVYPLHLVYFVSVVSWNNNFATTLTRGIESTMCQA